MKKLIAVIPQSPCRWRFPPARSGSSMTRSANIQQILDEAENIAEYVTMIDNQVQQITTLGNQLSEFKNYESLFGNPSQVVLSMVAPLDADLQSLEPGLEPRKSGRQCQRQYGADLQ